MLGLLPRPTTLPLSSRIRSNSALWAIEEKPKIGRCVNQHGVDRSVGRSVGPKNLVVEGIVLIVGSSEVIGREKKEEREEVNRRGVS